VGYNDQRNDDLQDNNIFDIAEWAQIYIPETFPVQLCKWSVSGKSIEKVINNRLTFYAKAD
jgi:hypothetical protein